jgi:hypothetical protein
VLWWVLAPRADFRVTDSGPVPIGHPSNELLAADDAVFALVLAGLGLLAGVVAWRLRRHRGVAVLVAVAVGAGLAALLSWQLGELLGPGPTKAALADVGARVTTGLHLGSLPALAVAPFAAVLVYVGAAAYQGEDGLGRTERPPQHALRADGVPADGRRLVEAPPPA